MCPGLKVTHKRGFFSDKEFKKRRMLRDRSIYDYKPAAY